MKREHVANPSPITNERNEATDAHHSMIQGTVKRAFARHRLVSLALTLTLLLGLFASFPLRADATTPVWDGTADTQWGGQGTADEPYLISSAAELAGLAKM